MLLDLILFIQLLVIGNVVGVFRAARDVPSATPTEADQGQPLFLTPLLEEGRFEEAQQQSKVKPDIGNSTSYSGFFTVNKECESNLFFWFFPAQKENWKDAPLLLWIHGEPWGSAFSAVFESLGPFESYEDGLKERQYSWNKENNLLIFDQPVGVGYSFTGKECYPANQTDVAKDLYQAVVQFHKLFPHFTNNKFFISGSYFAGQYIPPLALAIHKNNPIADVKINLVAMLIGNGRFDAASQIDYASYLYQIGLIDDHQKNVITKIQNNLLQGIADKEDWQRVTWTFIELNDLLQRFVGRVDFYNYNSQPKNLQNWESFLTLPEIRNGLHVGNLSFQSGISQSSKRSHSALWTSMKPLVEELLEEYPIIFFNGQLDISAAYPMMINFLRSMNWSGKDKYLKAPRKHWCYAKAGYYKGEHNLYDVLVRNAGFYVASDQPRWAYQLINSVTSGTKDNPLHALSALEHC